MASDGDYGLIDRIYEAAAVPDRWPDVLDTLARRVGAAGGLFFVRSLGGVRWIASPGVAPMVADYISEGWMDPNERAAPLVEELYPGFRTDSDFRTPDEMARMPVYADFLAPRGMTAAAGTVIQGAEHDAIVMTLEGFASHGASNAAVTALDQVRPHLARALTISARLQTAERRAALDGLTALGAAAAIVDRDGRLRAANAAFMDRLGEDVVDHRRRIRFAQPGIDVDFAALLDANRNGHTVARSVAFQPRSGETPCVLHVAPLRGSANDLFESDGVMLILAGGENANIPGADLLRMLFDLTPSEARLARALIAGRPLAQAAADAHVKETTARTQLKAIFAKTGVNRQSDLVRLLLGYGAAGASGVGGDMPSLVR